MQYLWANVRSVLEGFWPVRDQVLCPHDQFKHKQRPNKDHKSYGRTRSKVASYSLSTHKRRDHNITISQQHPSQYQIERYVLDGGTPHRQGRNLQGCQWFYRLPGIWKIWIRFNIVGREWFSTKNEEIYSAGYLDFAHAGPTWSECWSHLEWLAFHAGPTLNFGQRPRLTWKDTSAS